MEQFLSFAQNTGLAAALLVGMLIGLYKLGKLVVTLILVPMAQSHIKFLDVSCTNMEKISRAQDNLNSKMDSVCKVENVCKVEKIVTALLLLCLPSLASADPKGAVVRIPSHGGSGTVIATGQNWSLILTAGHCFDQRSRGKPITLDVIGPGGAGKVGISFMGADYAQDVALVRLNYGPLPHVAPVAPAGFRPGLCLSGGFDDMQFPGQWRTTHIIPDRGDGYTYTVEPPWHGRSGGGLIDQQTGYLVGVCSGYTGAHSRDDRMRGKGVYASHASILAFLRRTQGIQVADEPQLSRPPQLFEQRACPT